jgi:hypothetical protein
MRAGAIKGFTVGEIPHWRDLPESVEHRLAVTRRGREKTAIPGVGLTGGHPVVALDDSLGDGVAGETGDVMDV